MELIGYIEGYGLKILGAIAIFLIGKQIAKALNKLIIKSLKKSNLDETLVTFLENIIYAILLVVVILAALSNVGVDLTSLVAILGAAGLAIALSLQGSLSNIGASVLIMVFRPFKIGDYVDAGGSSGTVEEIDLFSTTLTSVDNKVVVVPNNAIIGNNIINYSRKETRRVDLVFGIGYDDDLKKAKNLLIEIANSDGRVLQDPAPFVAVGELADSSVNFTVRVWTKTSDYWGVHFDYIENVKLKFDENNISIPYPQIDIHQKN